MTSEHYRRNGFREWFQDVGYLYLIVVGSLVVLFAVAELAEGGFMVAAMTGGLDGTPLAEDSQVLGIIAEAS